MKPFKKSLAKAGSALAITGLLAGSALALAGPSQAAAAGGQCFVDSVVTNTQGQPVQGVKLRISNAIVTDVNARNAAEWAAKAADPAYQAALSVYYTDNDFEKFNLVQKAATARAKATALVQVPDRIVDVVATTGADGKARLLSGGWVIGGLVNDCLSMDKGVAVKAVPAGYEIPTQKIKPTWVSSNSGKSTITLTVK